MQKMFVIPFHNINPIALSIGPFNIYWYSISYIVGILLGYFYCIQIIKKNNSKVTPKQIYNIFEWIILGIIIGGRLGHIIFYDISYYTDKPWEIFYLWEGGMSFHGGLIGVSISTILFSKKHKIPILSIGDLIAMAAPIGLFFGRIANFINGELYGRIANLPWCIIFPAGGLEPRHPSQLYEALLEGILLFYILFFINKFSNVRHKFPGLIIGIFIFGYGIARIFVEFFREPNIVIYFFSNEITMGQLLSIPLLIIGLITIIFAIKQKNRNVLL